MLVSMSISHRNVPGVNTITVFNAIMKIAMVSIAPDDIRLA